MVYTLPLCTKKPYNYAFLSYTKMQNMNALEPCRTTVYSFATYCLQSALLTMLYTKALCSNALNPYSLTQYNYVLRQYTTTVLSLKQYTPEQYMLTLSKQEKYTKMLNILLACTKKRYSSLYTIYPFRQQQQMDHKLCSRFV